EHAPDDACEIGMAAQSTAGSASPGSPPASEAPIAILEPPPRSRSQSVLADRLAWAGPLVEVGAGSVRTALAGLSVTAEAVLEGLSAARDAGRPSKATHWVLSDVDAVLKACREAGIGEANDHHRRACLGQFVVAKEVDNADDTVNCYVPSLGRNVWFAARALSKTSLEPTPALRAPAPGPPRPSRCGGTRRRRTTRVGVARP
ncbi:unnamed protein product, partial [Prorocentrum cordatum]